MALRRRNPSRKYSVSRRRTGPSLIGKLLSRLFKKTEQLQLEVEDPIRRDISAIFYLTASVLILLAALGKLGPLGLALALGIQNIVGVYGLYLVPVILAAIGLTLLIIGSFRLSFTRIVGITLVLASFLGIVHLAAPEKDMYEKAVEYGGYIGFVSSFFFRTFLGTLGAHIILFALFLTGLLITSGISLIDAYHALTSFLLKEPNDVAPSPRQKTTKATESASDAPAPVAPAPILPLPEEGFRINRPASVKVIDSDFKPQKNKVAEEDWVPPSLDLLDASPETETLDEAVLRDKADQIRQKLSSFGIDVTMHDVNVGPSVMQYTLKPREGVKLSQIANLQKDLAMELAASSLRIQAPIPGKSLVGIEIPNENRITVRLKELLKSEDFEKVKSSLRLVLGRDVSGHPVISDLAAMPHLLIAGATGMGKSVAINTFLLSLIYQNSPTTLRLILVDPKMVEMTPYNGIPHLLTPVIKEPDKTISALKWAIAEMTRRYQALSKIKVRNISEYNEKVDDEQKLPFIVIVIDELADLMAVAKKEVEGCIQRLAQMARAVGIHLIVATQRPSVDVVTGVIKANLPTRLALRTISAVDSKTILDCIGAEELLGKGDMLFIPPGSSDPVRVQGVLVTTDEVTRVTNAIKLELGEEEPDYDEAITDKEQTASIQIPGLQPDKVDDSMSDDEVLMAALRVIVESGKASASLLQRRLSLGYARAARILDALEEKGYIGPGEGAKPRSIFVSRDQLSDITGSSSAAVVNALDDMERERNNW